MTVADNQGIRVWTASATREWGQLGFRNARLSLDFGPLILYNLRILKTRVSASCFGTVSDRA